MKIRNEFLPFLALAVLLGPAPAHASEHPEHPAKRSEEAPAEPKKEHPEHPAKRSKEAQAEPKKEHPEHPDKSTSPSAGKPSKTAPPKEAEFVTEAAIMRDFAGSVEGYVGAKEEDEGSFQVLDEELHKTWKLTLVRVHKDRIARLGKEKFFACADFKTIAGTEAGVDLDFFMTRSGSGSWRVDEVLVHKVDGLPRYIYNEENQRVPVPVKERHKHRKPAAAEKKPPKKAKPKLKPAEPPEHPAGDAEHEAEHPSGGGKEHPEHPQ